MKSINFHNFHHVLPRDIFDNFLSRIFIDMNVRQGDNDFKSLKPGFEVFLGALNVDIKDFNGLCFNLCKDLLSRIGVCYTSPRLPEFPDCFDEWRFGGVCLFTFLRISFSWAWLKVVFFIKFPFPHSTSNTGLDGI